ncbi:MAG: hypothetical protein ACK5KU_02625 [Beutenbergiaceae bacterium]
MTVRYWRPGMQVYWREPGSSQIGLDPRCAAVVDGLDPVQQALLERLPQLGSEPDLDVVARNLGVGRAPVRLLLDRLETAGFLIHDRPLHDGPDERYWHHAAVAGQPRHRERGGTCARLVGLDEVGLRIAHILARSGVGTLILDDTAPVRTDDLSSDGYQPDDLGQPRQDRALVHLRMNHPTTCVTATPARPDLVVVVAHGVVDPVLIRPLLRQDLAHLPVLVRELDVMVGPLVQPGSGPCLRCLDLARSDDDSRWPAVATQVSTRPPTGTESVLAWYAAGLAAHQALAWLDGRGTELDGASLELTATYPLPRLRRWQVHPHCGCNGVRPRGGEGADRQASAQPVG